MHMGYNSIAQNIDNQSHRPLFNAFPQSAINPSFLPLNGHSHPFQTPNTDLLHTVVELINSMDAIGFPVGVNNRFNLANENGSFIPNSASVLSNLANQAYLNRLPINALSMNGTQGWVTKTNDNFDFPLDLSMTRSACNLKRCSGTPDSGVHNDSMDSNISPLSPKSFNKIAVDESTNASMTSSYHIISPTKALYPNYPEINIKVESKWNSLNSSSASSSAYQQHIHEDKEQEVRDERRIKDNFNRALTKKRVDKNLSRMSHLKPMSNRLIGSRPYATPAKTQICNQCNAPFYSTKELDDHTQQLHQTYRCTFPSCQVTFTQRSNLNRHCLGHLRNKPIHCTLCGKRFKRKDHCVKHIQESHGIMENCREYVDADIATSKCLEALGLIDASTVRSNSLKRKDTFAQSCGTPEDASAHQITESFTSQANLRDLHPETFYHSESVMEGLSDVMDVNNVEESDQFPSLVDDTYIDVVD